METITQITTIHAPIERCFDLARSAEVHLAGNVHCGEQAIASGGVTCGLIGMGQRVTWRARHFFVRQTLTSEITAMQPPIYFQDTMIHGAFRSMQHDHYFETLPSGDTEMKNIFRFAAPLPLLGPVAEALVLRRYMRALLHERSQVIKQIAESSNWREYLPCES